MTTEKATFGAGCFWHVQFAFSKLRGVKTTAGYMGGDEKRYPNPTYEQVCSNKTGYIEVVQVEFDPKKTKYEKLLDVFWGMHDPTSQDRQGFDMGVQYRSVIFYHNKKQKALAEASKKELTVRSLKPVVTEIRAAATFFRAEEYHQDYVRKTGHDVCPTPSK
jgi:peptide-methionine (S)-S-oxide reductase